MIERRSLQNYTADAGKIRLSIPFNSWSEDVGGFRERILPGAFDRTLRASDEVLALWSHNPDKPLAKRSNSTLALAADDTALAGEITPDTTSWSEDAKRSVSAGTASGASFAFRVAEGGDRWYRKNGAWRRDLIDVSLIELSPVAAPAYPGSAATTSV